jgi:twitching motility protein PilT
MKLHDLLSEMVQAGASALHITAGSPPMFRISGLLQTFDGAFAAVEPDSVLDIAEEFFGFSIGDGEGPVSFFASAVHDNRRFRGTLFVSERTASLVIAALPERVPQFAVLNPPPQVARLLDLDEGLVIIAGGHGSGKTTTLLAIADEINMRHSVGICILDGGDMPDISPAKSAVHLVPFDPVMGAADAFRYALQADANVIVGHIEDEYDLEGALQCASAGCLVLVTYQADDVAEALEGLAELAECFPRGPMMLADLLQACVSQELRSENGSGLRASYEVLWNDADVAGLIMGEETAEIVPELLKRKGNLARNP